MTCQKLTLDTLKQKLQGKHMEYVIRRYVAGLSRVKSADFVLTLGVSRDVSSC